MSFAQDEKRLILKGKTPDESPPLRRKANVISVKKIKTPYEAPPRSKANVISVKRGTPVYSTDNSTVKVISVKRK